MAQSSSTEDLAGDDRYPTDSADGVDTDVVGASGDKYVVVARRYRPRGFDELVGQEHVGRALKNAIETNRVGHAYLFTGARGVGKTSTARIFAKALNDPDGPTATPDNTTDVAMAIDAGEDIDVIEIDGASNRGIDEIRSLRANAGVRPSRSRYKIYIIDEVHMLTTPAFNALLKTLEEPPEHVKFIFCTTDPDKIPITVLSRCQRFDFAPVELQGIVGRLKEIVDAEGVDADEAALEMIARRAAGSMRDSQSLLEQVLSFGGGRLTVDQVHAMLGTADDERLHALALAMSEHDPASTLRLLDEAVDAGVDAARLAEQLLGYFRDLMAVTVGCDASLLRHAHPGMLEELQRLGQQWGLQTVLAAVGMLDQCLTRTRHSLYGRALLEATLIQICKLPDLQTLADLTHAANEAVKSGGVSGLEKKKPQAGANVGRANKQQPEPHRSKSPADDHAPTQEAVVQDAPTQDAPARRDPTRPSQPVQQADEQVSSSARSTTPSPAPELSASGVSASELSRAESSGAGVTGAGVVGAGLSGAGLTQESSASSAVATLDRVDPRGGGSVVWDQATVDRIWKTTVERLEAMTETIARMVQRVEPQGDSTLRLTFPHDAALALQRCQLPEHQSTLQTRLSEIVGQPIQLQYRLADPPASSKREAVRAPKQSRHQRMREIESHPLVNSCVEIFDAAIVRIDKPK